jgi:hypothetical protein
MSLEFFPAVDATKDSMFASNTGGGTITAILAVTNIPLPHNQNLSNFTVNPANDTFTVPVTGRYFISYQVNATATLAVTYQLILNGSTPIPGSIVSQIIGVSGYSCNVIVSLTKGNTISLQAVGLAVILSLPTAGSTGAALTIIRLS